MLRGPVKLWVAERMTEVSSALFWAMLLAQAAPDCAKNYFLSRNYLILRKITFRTFTGIGDSNLTKPEKGYPDEL